MISRSSALHTQYTSNATSFQKPCPLPSGWVILTLLGTFLMLPQTRKHLPIESLSKPKPIVSSLMKRQLAFLISRAQVPLQWLQIPLTEDEAEDSFESDLQDCLFNAKLSEHFRAFGKELGVEEARSLEEVYKSHLENTRASISMISRIFF